MDQNAASAPGLIFSLEAMIQASVTSILDRRLGSAAENLDVQIQAAVAAAIDKRLRLEVGSLGNRMTSLIDQRLGDAVSTLNHRVNSSVAAALEQRLGPVGSSLTAQVTFTAAPFSALTSVPPPKAQVLDEADGAKESKETCPAEEERATAEPTRNDGPIELVQLTKKQSAAMSQASQGSPDSVDGMPTITATAGESNQLTSKETDATVYPLFAGSASKKKVDTSATVTTKPNAIHEELSRSADKAPTKRKANQEDKAKKADESEASSSEEESNNQKDKPKRKRSKVKLDPPGFTNGPTIKFRRVNPKLTASAKCRGYPRVVDLRSFSEASNKQNFTMADVIATVLFNYDPLSLDAFMEMDMYPTFQFVRNETDRKAKVFAIEKRRESYGVLVECGYHLSPIERAKHRSDGDRIWETKYEYIILPVGKWVASNYTQDPVISNSSKRAIEQWATEFGTRVFLDKLWVEGPQVRIEANKLESR